MPLLLTEANALESLVTDAAENGDIVVAIINDEATVKRFFRRRNNISLEPANPNMKPIIIKKSQAHEMIIVGKVVTVLRQIK